MLEPFKEVPYSIKITADKNDQGAIIATIRIFENKELALNGIKKAHSENFDIEVRPAVDPLKKFKRVVGEQSFYLLQECLGHKRFNYDDEKIKADIDHTVDLLMSTDQLTGKHLLSQLHDSHDATPNE